MSVELIPEESARLALVAYVAESFITSRLASATGSIEHFAQARLHAEEIRTQSWVDAELAVDAVIQFVGELDDDE